MTTIFHVQPVTQIAVFSDKKGYGSHVIEAVLVSIETSLKRRAHVEYYSEYYSGDREVPISNLFWPIILNIFVTCWTGRVS